MNLYLRFMAFAVSAVAVLALITASASAGGRDRDERGRPFSFFACWETQYKQVVAFSKYTTDSHIHLDIACPHDYRAIACGFDIGGDRDDGQNQQFVAINDASPYHFDSDHSDYPFEGEYGCHFRANNFAAYFPKYKPFYWNLKGTATCVPKDCVSVDETYDYYQDSQDAVLSWDWE
jgi:hypothetical protein